VTLWRSILAAATGKARLPTVESLKGGTTKRLVPEERRERRKDTSATWWRGPIHVHVYRRLREHCPREGWVTPGCGD